MEMDEGWHTEHFSGDLVLDEQPYMNLLVWSMVLSLWDSCQAAT